jgi:multimeric flavodoxin WrbA
MKALAINGSPRKDGNTKMLLEATLAPLTAAGWETELVQLGGRNIHGCRACFKCWEKKDNHCVFGKDVFNEVYEKMLSADAIILGSPTYFSDVTAEMKALIDRSGFVSMANGCTFAGKIGAAVVAVRRGGGTHVFDTMNHLFFISQMLVPGSTYWNLGFGLGEKEVAGDDEALRNMEHLGQAVDWLGKAISASAVPYPVRKSGEA